MDEMRKDFEATKKGLCLDRVENGEYINAVIEQQWHAYQDGRNHSDEVIKSLLEQINGLQGAEEATTSIEIAYKQDGHYCITPCHNIEGIGVGSLACQDCNHFLGYDKVARIVRCGAVKS